MNDPLWVPLISICPLSSCEEHATEEFHLRGERTGGDTWTQVEQRTRLRNVRTKDVWTSGSRREKDGTSNNIERKKNVKTEQLFIPVSVSPEILWAAGSYKYYSLMHVKETVLWKCKRVLAFSILTPACEGIIILKTIHFNIFCFLFLYIYSSKSFWGN